jgi:hypothetical protein
MRKNRFEDAQNDLDSHQETLSFLQAELDAINA